MITKETAREIYNCYQQIEEIDKLKDDMLKEIERIKKKKEEDYFHHRLHGLTQIKKKK